MLTQERIQEVLFYDEKTGKFFWYDNGPKRYRGEEAGWRMKSGHIRIKLDGHAYLAHRLAWFLAHGTWPELLDHINQNPADNRIENLREASRYTNRLNSRLGKNNKSGYTGVFLHKVTGKWGAVASINGKQKHFGVFEKIEDAVAARKAALLTADGGAHRRYGLAKN
jgi:hypothetical protein